MKKNIILMIFYCLLIPLLGFSQQDKGKFINNFDESKKMELEKITAKVYSNGTVKLLQEVTITESEIVNYLKKEEGVSFSFEREASSRFNKTAVFKKYQQHYKGVKVDGGGYTVKVNKNPSLNSSGLELFSPRVFHGIDVNVKPTFSLDQVAEKLHVEAVHTPELLVSNQYTENYQLLWKVFVSDGPGAGTKQIWVNAHSGAIVNTVVAQLDLAATTSTYGAQNLNDTNVGGTTEMRSAADDLRIYEGLNPSNPVVVSQWTNNLTPTTPTANNNWDPNSDIDSRQNYYVADIVVPLFGNMGVNFGNVNIAVSGTAVALFGSTTADAFIQVSDFSGTPLSLFDVIGHELAHVWLFDFLDYTNNNTNMSLHEGISDIVGTYIESFVQGTDWVMGDDEPVVANIVDRDLSVQVCETDLTGAGRHQRGRVISHWFFALTTGIPADNICPLGMQTTLDLIIEGLNNLNNQNAGFPEMRTETLLAAENAFGVCSKEYESVVNAWDRVCVPGPFETCQEEIVTTSIWPRDCVLKDFTIKGTSTDSGNPAATAVTLQFCENGSPTGVSVNATLDNNGDWEWAGTMQSLIALGLEFGGCYDVKPIMTLSNGSTVAGDEFEAGTNNDVCFADQSDPVVVVNSSPTDFTTSLTRICDGDPIYYHGTDPLSGNHHSSIKRRPTGSPIPFIQYQSEGWIGTSLDGYTGDLVDQYPGYFQVGWEYQLKISTSNNDPDVCIAWTEEFVEFSIVDCCEPEVNILRIPDCVEDGVPFTVRVEILAPLNPSDIWTIFSSYPNFSGGSWTVVSQTGGSLILDIRFTSNSCTCEGEMLVFDIITDCGAVWVMTEKLPCCADPCQKTAIVDTQVGDCVLVNGKPSREFCFEINSGGDFTGVSAGNGNSPCEMDLEGLEITQTGNGTYTVCGYMVFQDPDCTHHADVELIFESEYGCCSVSKQFSFPGDCVPPEGCVENAPNIEVIYGSQVNVSLGLPQGTQVTVTNANNGTSTSHAVGSVSCGPFAVDQNGGVSGSKCNGIILPGTQGIDCRPTEENPNPSHPYHFVITYGECTWVLIGDYCDEFIVYPVRPNGGDGTRRSTEVESNQSFSDKVMVYPNPVDQSGILNFDLGNSKSIVQEVMITDISGKTIESFVPDTGQNQFQHTLNQPLPKGIYLAVLRFEDGTVNSTKLVAVE